MELLIVASTLILRIGVGLYVHYSLESMSVTIPHIILDTVLTNMLTLLLIAILIRFVIEVCGYEWVRADNNLYGVIYCLGRICYGLFYLFLFYLLYILWCYASFMYVVKFFFFLLCFPRP